MPELTPWLPMILASYLLGAIPFGLLIGRMRGVDVRAVGSRNIGATNVLRTVGKPWGIATFALDALKGFVPVFVFPHYGSFWGGEFHSMELAKLAGGAAAIIGHNFPVYLRFRGGKGVATSAGALLGIAPIAVAVGLVVWVAFFFALRYVSLASIAAAVAAPVAGWVWYRDSGWILPAALTLLGALIILRHRENIRRLLDGTENRFQRKSKR
jgi:glycerol-3-phosphate acyltransferase PlsY